MNSTEGQTVLGWTDKWYAHLAYVLVIVAALLAIPSTIADDLWHVQGGVIGAFGVLAIWRYGWGLTHFFRAIFYRRFTFRRLRKQASEAFEAIASNPPHAYLLVTSYKIDGDTSASVYRAAFRAAMASPGKATVVASVVELSDQRLVTNIYRLICGDSSKVALTVVRIKGTGKRDALAHGLRSIARAIPRDNDVVAVIDGDSIVPDDLVTRCAGFFAANPRVGALTTDEVSDVRGKAIFHLWYSLRFAQRNVLMASNGQSQRVLTLTGRMSMYRASVACDPGFIDQIESDYIEHWRLGRIKFLTGDDKSTWFWLLRHGYLMLYIPDIVVATVESPPSDNFVEAAAQLMTRWFGNMLRTNGRALALGPHKVGLFTWWAIFDQRISMWTSLAGLAMTIIVGLLVSPTAFLAYIVWILCTRYVQTLMLLTSRKRVSILYVPLIYFNQIFGSIIKTYIFFRLNRQRWTRQSTTLARSGHALRAALADGSSVFMHGLALTLFVVAVAWFVGILPFPDYYALGQLLGRS